MPAKTPITVAHGDGIGPEIMAATLQILDGPGAALEIETIEIGEKVYLRGNSAGIDPISWESLLRTKVFLKAPITTPQGGGFKSLNVTTRARNALAEALGKLAGDGLAPQMIDNRGMKLWPAGRAETFCIDSFRCRFMAEGRIGTDGILARLGRVASAGIEIAATQSLRIFDSKAGFTLAQGQ